MAIVPGSGDLKFFCQSEESKFLIEWSFPDRGLKRDSQIAPDSFSSFAFRLLTNRACVSRKICKTGQIPGKYLWSGFLGHPGNLVYHMKRDVLPRQRVRQGNLFLLWLLHLSHILPNKATQNTSQCHTRVRTQKRKSGWKSYKCGAIEKWYLVKSRNRRRPYDLTWGVGNLGQGRLSVTSLDDPQHTFLNQARFTFLYNPQFQILIGYPKLVIHLFSANYWIC